MDTNTSIQQKAAQALSEINKLEGEDNLFQYILCLLKYSILPAYSIKHKDLKTRLTNHLVSHSKMERGLRATINPIDDGCNIDINIIVDKDFSKQDQELLNELNKIINNIDNSYLWRELSEFDLKLRERLKIN